MRETQVTKRRNEYVMVRLDHELLESAHTYAQSHSVSLSAIVRACLRKLVDPTNPQPLPPGTQAEMVRSQYRHRRRRRRLREASRRPVDWTGPHE